MFWTSHLLKCAPSKIKLQWFYCTCKDTFCTSSYPPQWPMTLALLTNSSIVGTSKDFTEGVFVVRRFCRLIICSFFFSPLGASGWLFGFLSVLSLCNIGLGRSFFWEYSSLLSSSSSSRVCTRSGLCSKMGSSSSEAGSSLWTWRTVLAKVTLFFLDWRFPLLSFWVNALTSDNTSWLLESRGNESCQKGLDIAWSMGARYHIRHSNENKQRKRRFYMLDPLENSVITTCQAGGNGI